MAEESRKSELIATLAAKRREVSANFRGLRHDLNVVHHVETSFRRHRVAWMAGGSMFGFLITRLVMGRKKVVVAPKLKKGGPEEKVVKAGLLMTVLKITFDIVRPTLTKWLTRQVATFAEQRFGRPAGP